MHKVKSPNHLPPHQRSSHGKDFRGQDSWKEVACLIRTTYRTNKREKLSDSESLLQGYLQKYEVNEVKAFYVFMASCLQQKPGMLC